MLTFARGFAALTFGALAWYISGDLEAFKPFDVTYADFRIMMAGIGVITGWVFLGGNAGESLAVTIGSSITSIVAFVLLTCSVFGAYQMLVYASEKRYSDIMSAVEGWIEIGVKMGAAFMYVETGSILVAGAILIGFGTAFVARATD